MIKAYLIENCVFKIYQIDAHNLAKINQAIWLDLFDINSQEEQWIEQALKIDIPTREEMQEIELSSRLYKDQNEVLFMTAVMLAQSSSRYFTQDSVTFVLTAKRLITVRYIEPDGFRSLEAKLTRLKCEQLKLYSLLIELLDSIIDKLADTLEISIHQLEGLSQTIFMPSPPTSDPINYQNLIQEIGANANINTKIRESLITLNRLISFFNQSAAAMFSQENNQRIALFIKDIHALSDQANFLSNKVNFLLDATLGFINIQQNATIKIFSVVAVIFLPPTLIASVYGMNFHFIPELSFKYGYFYALGLMILSAWLPYKFFRYKKWL